MAACIPPRNNFAPRQAGTTKSCVLGHLTDTIFLFSLSVCSFLWMFWSYTTAFLVFITTLNSCACVFYIQCLSTVSFLLSISVSSTSLSLIGGNTDTGTWCGRCLSLPQSISHTTGEGVGSAVLCTGLLLSCTTKAPCCIVYLSTSVSEGLFTISNLSGTYWRLSMLQFLLSHHNFNKKFILFSR